MNRTDIRHWETAPERSWNDSPATSTRAGEVTEWEANLLLPQLVAALEHQASAAPAKAPVPASCLLSLWRQLRASAPRPLALHRVLQVH